MNIRILQLVEGAKQARGLTVVIDNACALAVIDGVKVCGSVAKATVNSAKTGNTIE